MEAWRHIQTILNCEYLPYTQNDHYYQVTKENYLSRYKDARAGQSVFVPPSNGYPKSVRDLLLVTSKSKSKVRTLRGDPNKPLDILKYFKGNIQPTKDEGHDNLEQQALSALAAIGYHVSPADLGKLVPPDVYEKEMDVMAEVRAYFQVAYKVTPYHVRCVRELTHLLVGA